MTEGVHVLLTFGVGGSRYALFFRCWKQNANHSMTIAKSTLPVSQNQDWPDLRLQWLRLRLRLLALQHAAALQPRYTLTFVILHRTMRRILCSRVQLT